MTYDDLVEKHYPDYPDYDNPDRFKNLLRLANTIFHAINKEWRDLVPDTPQSQEFFNRRLLPLCTINAELMTQLAISEQSPAKLAADTQTTKMPAESFKKAVDRVRASHADKILGLAKR